MKTLVVAPHPDDELLGCAGTLLRRSSDGCTVGWLLLTGLNTGRGWTDQQIYRRSMEIDNVRTGLGIDKKNFYNLNYHPAELDQIPISDLVGSISEVFTEFSPEEVFLPHPSDVHSDHRITFDASSACTKWFRYPSIKRVLTYETISETDFGINPALKSFEPNLYVDISSFLDSKLNLLGIYKSEIADHPFPRSFDSIRALATLRGSQMGSYAAEAFQILRQFE